MDHPPKFFIAYQRRNKRAKLSQRRDWNDLPFDILSIVAHKVGITELFCFMLVCKSWKSAASSATAAIESSPGRKPWFLMYGENSLCILVAQSGKKGSISLPGLVGATCIASSNGWLLLLDEETGLVSFFCPFSRAKLDLPSLPKHQSCNLVATFSSPPTSPACIVAILFQKDKEDIKLYIIRRGEKEWTSHTTAHHRNKSVKAAIYFNGRLYFPYTANGLLAFILDKGLWSRYTVLPHNRPFKGVEALPFHLKMAYFKARNMKEELGLEDGACIKTCGTSVSEHRSCHNVVFNESIGDGVDKPETKCLKGVWICPRFFQVGPEFSW